MNPAKKPIDWKNVAAKVDVDNRIPLRNYFRIADNLLEQARIFREEKNTLNLYIMLLRYSSLLSETIPFHPEYYSWPTEEVKFHKKKMLQALDELQSLKPEVERQINEINEVDASNQQHRDGDQETTLHVSGLAPTVNNEQASSSLGNRLGSASKSSVYSSQAPNVPPTAPPTEEDLDMAMAIYASLQSAAAEETHIHAGCVDFLVSIQRTCVICLDAPIEGACVPCGHMAGCMSCLNEIKSKKLSCPVCRAKVDLVIRLYPV